MSELFTHTHTNYITHTHTWSHLTVSSCINIYFSFLTSAAVLKVKISLIYSFFLFSTIRKGTVCGRRIGRGMNFQPSSSIKCAKWIWIKIPYVCRSRAEKRLKPLQNKSLLRSVWDDKMAVRGRISQVCAEEGWRFIWSLTWFKNNPLTVST